MHNRVSRFFRLPDQRMASVATYPRIALFSVMDCELIRLKGNSTLGTNRYSLIYTDITCNKRRVLIGASKCCSQLLGIRISM